MKQLKLVSASWCGPCSLLKKRINDQKLQVDIVDVDSNVDFVREYSIKSVPTLVVIEDDGTFSHVRGADEILSIIKDNQKEL
jgi:thioredoxin-like negative regulator of GroEL